VRATNDEELRRTVEERISPNAWPILSPALAGAARRGIDPDEARRFTIAPAALVRFAERAHARGRRAEHALGIANAFHTVLHNHEVLLRLLALEWPAGPPLPAELGEPIRRVFRSFDEVEPALSGALSVLVAAGVPAHVLARDVLAALGHDYGHTGDADRRHRDGTQTPLTHEEAAEKHVAACGLELGMPPALVLEAMAGIRATAFFTRPGRTPVRAATDFEKRLGLADVAGWVLPAERWLCHVAVAVLVEKLPRFRKLVAEGSQDPAIPRDFPQWLRGERGFLGFIETRYVDAVPQARGHWGETLRSRMAAVDQALASDALPGLADGGFELLERFAAAVCDRDGLGPALRRADLDPRLAVTLSPFLS
jgi:hypothetical protein